MPDPILIRKIGGGGKYTPLAAKFVAASSQFGSIASNASLQMGAGVDMTLAAWVNLNTLTGNQNIILKSNVAGTTIEYLLYHRASSTFQFYVTSNGAASTVVNSILIPTAGVWNFIVARYDGTNISIAANGGTLGNTAYSADIFSSTQRFTLGSNDGGDAFLDGMLDSVGLWKSARGAGGALTTGQITTLYNGGAGLRYKTLPGSLLPGLVSWWDFSGNFNDPVSGNNLANNAGVTFVPGLI